MSDEPILLELEKQALIDAAEQNFGKAYFDQLEKLSQDLLLQEEDPKAGFTITVNYCGVFYANQH